MHGLYLKIYHKKLSLILKLPVGKHAYVSCGLPLIFVDFQLECSVLFSGCGNKKKNNCEKSEEEEQGILAFQVVVILCLQQVKRSQRILVQVAFVLEVSFMYRTNISS